MMLKINSKNLVLCWGSSGKAISRTWTNSFRSDLFFPNRMSSSSWGLSNSRFYWTLRIMSRINRPTLVLL